jgi:uncharacterized protein (DUF362 family)/Pyruvate/2-oxoacid:ferredoxin oxidoreductase delta subunit
VRRAVTTCVEELPDLQEALLQADSVLLKPNLLSSTREPEEHVNTHPAVVRALAEQLIEEFSCEVAIGDSSGSFTRGSTRRALERSRMLEVAGAVGACIYNVDAQPRHVAVHPGSRIYREIPLPANLDRFDLIISVAKLKTHVLTYTTGPVKNMLGLVPGGAKKQAHMKAPHPGEFATLLCDLYAALPRAVAFVDGIVGMEGKGPSNGGLRHMELLAASTDPVALDSFCAEAMGFEPLQIPLLAACQSRELGVAARAEILARGEPAAAFAPKDFAKPPTYAQNPLGRLVPAWLLRSAMRTFSVCYATIDEEACRACGECARNCPSNAISLDRNADAYHVDRHRCTSCYCCVEVCPYDAVSVEPTGMTKLARWLRSPFRGGSD